MVVHSRLELVVSFIVAYQTDGMYGPQRYDLALSNAVSRPRKWHSNCGSVNLSILIRIVSLVDWRLTRVCREYHGCLRLPRIWSFMMKGESLKARTNDPSTTIFWLPMIHHKDIGNDHFASMIHRNVKMMAVLLCLSLCFVPLYLMNCEGKAMHNS